MEIAITHTVKEIYDLPDGERAELIDGKIYYMTPPNRRHQEIVGELFGTIREYIKSNHGVCKPYVAPFAVFLNADDKNYVEPDISIICDRNKLNEKGCVGAPDWIIEVVSPDSRRIDYTIKLFKYRTAGVREYWIVDPEKNRVMVYLFNSDEMNEYNFSERIPAAVYPGFFIDFSALNL